MANSLYELGKHLYTFLNNSVFDRKTQNNRKQENKQFEKARNRHTSSVCFKGSQYISNFFRICEMSKNKTKIHYQYITMNHL